MLTERRLKQVEEATEALTKGIFSEAQRKREQEKVRYAYEEIRNGVMSAILDKMGKCEVDAATGRFIHTPEQEVLNNLYWSFPDFQHVKEETFTKFEEFGDMQTLRTLWELRKALKQMEITKIEKVQTEREVKIAKIEKTLAEIIAFRRKRFNEEVNLVHLFKKLHVSATPHWVVNHKGHKFLRFFYFLNGRFTALNTILAVAEETEDFMNEVYLEKLLEEAKKGAE